MIFDELDDMVRAVVIAAVDKRIAELARSGVIRQIVAEELALAVGTQERDPENAGRA